MEVYAIIYEDGSMDEGPVVLEDEVYSTMAVAEARRNELFEKAVHDKKTDPDYYRDGYLKNQFEFELKNQRYGNLVPLYQVTTLTVKDKPDEVDK